MRVVSVVGNRPQFVKAAPLSRALRARVDEVLVHSGQHYDPELADLFFDELG
ncbi:MAG: UDP-N-acetylglucosamine 2-epimerase (non-hydrolyzing), partial [Thermoleophilia bacterium]